MVRLRFEHGLHVLQKLNQGRFFSITHALLAKFFIFLRILRSEIMAAVNHKVFTFADFQKRWSRFCHEQIRGRFANKVATANLDDSFHQIFDRLVESF